jgi:hypothetical protein
MSTQTIRIVFDGPPAHTSGRFVEVETPDGRGVNAGRWVKDEHREGWWALELRVPSEEVHSEP